MNEQLYIDGKRQPVASLEAALAALKAGKNVIAVDSAGCVAEITSRQFRKARNRRAAR